MSFLYAIETGPPSASYPGPTSLYAGDSAAGFYGLCPDVYNGETLASDIGLTAGTSYNSTCDWLKFAWNEGIVMVPQKPFRYGISWDNINAIDAVYGGGSAPIVNINGNDYKVRLMRVAGQDPLDPTIQSEIIGSENEWNHLMLPIHANAPDSWGYPDYVDEPTEDWGIGFTDEDLLTHFDYGNGSKNWGQETYSGDNTYRFYRGYGNVSYAHTTTSDDTGNDLGWRPLLQKL